jgi:hypothetical protein
MILLVDHGFQLEKFRQRELVNNHYGKQGRDHNLLLVEFLIVKELIFPDEMRPEMSRIDYFVRYIFNRLLDVIVVCLNKISLHSAVEYFRVES